MVQHKNKLSDKWANKILGLVHCYVARLIELLSLNGFIHSQSNSGLVYSGLPSGHLDFFKLFQNDLRPKNLEESSYSGVSKNGLICLLTSKTFQDMAI